MRITNNMMVTNTIRNINSAANRLNNAEERVSSQLKISLPSDDPVVATRSIKYRSYVANVEQYQKNVSDASSWQSVTDDALTSLNDAATQIRTLAVKASSDSLNSSDKSDIATQVGELRQEIVDIMNTSYGGRYIFGGFETTNPPYETKTTTLGDNTTTFKGDYLSLGGVISSDVSDSDILSFCSSATAYTDAGDQSIKYNIGDNVSVTVNTEGQDVIGSGSDNLFNTIDKLLLSLNGDTTYKTYNSGTVTTNTLESSTELLANLDTNLNRISTAQATLGSRMSYVETASSHLENNYTTYTTLLSNNEDVDISKATIEESSAEAVYDASLSVGAKAISKTLVDYLV